MWFCKDFLFLNQVIQDLHSKYNSMNQLFLGRKIAKNWSQYCQISKIWLYFCDCVLFVAMATRHMILQSVIFLNHAEQELNYKYDVID